jgi:glycerol uptake facilitator-like aquaporin
MFSVGSIGGFINHLNCCQTIILTSSGRLGLPFVVWNVVLAFLGCWALIVFTFVIHHPILLDVMTHVEIDTSLF